MSKIWEKQWATNDFIENSNNWTLAGDVALLNTLKSFSDKLLKKSSEINENLTNLLQNVSEVGIKLDLAQNNFNSLRNTQFIESRVYEDDESVPEKDGTTTKESILDQDEYVKAAINKGLNIIDEYYTKIDVPISDSEDETDFPSYVLRPKDMYMERPLPYIIGSDEWHRKCHVGLESSSSSDSDNDDKSKSDNDSIQDTSLEIDYQFSKTISNDNDNLSEVAIGVNDNDIKFAEQLSAKLNEININNRPIRKIEPNYDNLFDDEPPPLENEEKGLFSSNSRNLFDDSDDNDNSSDLFNDNDNDDMKKVKSYLKPFTNLPEFTDDEPPSLNDNDKCKSLNDKLFKKVDLFDDNNDLFNDNLFSPNIETNKFKSNLFDDDNDNFFDNSKLEKSINSNVFKSSPSSDNDQYLPSNDKSDNFSFINDNNDKLFVDINEEKSLKTDDRIFRSLPSNDNSDNFLDSNDNKTRKFKSGLFDDDNGSDNDNLFGDKLQKSVNKDDLNITTTSPSDNDDNRDKKEAGLIFDNEPPNDLFNDNAKSLFDDNQSFNDIFSDNDQSKPVEEKSKLLSLFDDVPPPIDDDLFQTDKKISIFDDEPSINNDLFYVGVPEKLISDKLGMQNKTVSEKEPIFNDELSVNNDLFNMGVQEKFVSEKIKPREVLEKSEGIKSKDSPGKLKLSLNINVNALMPPKLSSAPKLVKQIEKTNEISIDNEEKIKVLHSITKDRAKMPLNRRPSTRKGRQAALKQSNSDFKLNLPENDKKSSENEEILKNTSKNVFLTSKTTEDYPKTSLPSEIVVSEEKLKKCKDLSREESDSESHRKENVKFDASKIKPENVKKEEMSKKSEKSLKKLNSNDLFEDIFSDPEIIEKKEKIQQFTEKEERDEKLEILKSEDLFSSSDNVSSYSDSRRTDEYVGKVQNEDTFDDVFVSSEIRNKEWLKKLKSNDLFGTAEDVFLNSKITEESSDVFEDVESEDLFIKSKDLNETKENVTKSQSEEVEETKKGLAFEASEFFFSAKPTKFMSEDILSISDSSEEYNEKFKKDRQSENLFGSSEDIFSDSSIVGKEEKRESLFGGTEDLFLGRSENVLKSLKTVKKTKIINSEDLFGSDEGLFSEENLKKIKKDVKNRSIFDDDEDNVFRNDTSKKIMKKPVKKSLFDDDDDEDDIFGPSTSNVKNVRNVKSEKIVKTRNVKKLENIKPEDDPLSDLFN